MRLVAAAALAAATCALAAPAAADAGRYAVGLAVGADPAVVGARIERAGGTVSSLAPVRALIVGTDDASALRRTRGVRYVETLARRSTAYTPTDPLVPQQWYLGRVRAFDAWTVLPPLAAVRVAVIDSGVDLGHPDLAGRIAEARSFVGGAPTDTSGHGTLVAGVIAAQSQNGIGIAGISPAAELLVAKVVEADGTISVEAEARAIRWAVRHGARVINMSLGGVRDPSNPDNDTYSRLEADAVSFAVSRGVVVVAAVGNGDQAPAEPWRYAFYPAALPHVLGVSAVGRNGAVPGYSNRDPVYNDIAAPGADIVSTFPRRLTRERPSCPEQGYTPCATASFRPAEGTSFATPQVSGAAATLLALRPELRPEQVTGVLERAAVDSNPTTGCGRCAHGRDPFSGWGTLDVATALEALEGALPSVDAMEANDDAGGSAHFLSGTWRRRLVDATTDYWDDQDDLYAVYMRRGRRIDAVLRGDQGELSLALWRPGTATVQGVPHQGNRIRMSAKAGPREYLGYRARDTGWHYVQVRMVAPGEGSYRLTVARH